MMNIVTAEADKNFSANPSFDFFVLNSPAGAEYVNFNSTRTS